MPGAEPLALRLIALPRVVVLSVFSLLGLVFGGPTLLCATLASSATLTLKDSTKNNNINQSNSGESRVSNVVGSQLVSSFVLRLWRMIWTLLALLSAFAVVSLATNAAMGSVARASELYGVADSGQGPFAIQSISVQSEKLLWWIFAVPLNVLKALWEFWRMESTSADVDGSYLDDLMAAVSVVPLFPPVTPADIAVRFPRSWGSKATALFVPWLMAATASAAVFSLAPRITQRWLTRMNRRFPAVCTTVRVESFNLVLREATIVPLLKLSLWGSICDLAALLLWSVVVILVIRISSLWRSDSSTTLRRSVVSVPARAVLLSLADWSVLLLAILTALVFPWRLTDIWSGWQVCLASKTDRDEIEWARRRLILRAAIDGAIDSPFVLLILPVVLTLWRAPILWKDIRREKEWSNCRALCAKHFVEWLTDCPFVVMLAVASFPLYRVPTLIVFFQENLNPSQRRRFIANQFFCVCVLDWLMLASSPVVVVCCFIPRSRRLVWTCFTPSASPLRSGYVLHISVFKTCVSAVTQVLWYDLPTTCGFAALLLVAPWRLPSLLRLWPVGSCLHTDGVNHAHPSQALLERRRSAVCWCVVSGLTDLIVLIAFGFSVLCGTLHASGAIRLLQELGKRLVYDNIVYCLTPCKCASCRETNATRSQDLADVVTLKQQQREEIARWRGAVSVDSAGQVSAKASNGSEGKSGRLLANDVALPSSSIATPIPRSSYVGAAARVVLSSFVDLSLILMLIVLLVFPWRFRSLRLALSCFDGCDCCYVLQSSRQEKQVGCKERRRMLWRTFMLWCIDLLNAVLTVMLAPFLWRSQRLSKIWRSTVLVLDGDADDTGGKAELWWNEHGIDSHSNLMFCCLFRELLFVMFLDVPLSCLWIMLASIAPWRIVRTSTAIRALDADESSRPSSTEFGVATLAQLSKFQASELQLRRRSMSIVAQNCVGGFTDILIAIAALFTLWRLPFILRFVLKNQHDLSRSNSMARIVAEIRATLWDVPTVPFLILCVANPFSAIRCISFLSDYRQRTVAEPLPWRASFFYAAVLGLLDLITWLSLVVCLIAFPWRAACCYRMLKFDFLRARKHGAGLSLLRSLNMRKDMPVSSSRGQHTDEGAVQAARASFQFPETKAKPEIVFLLMKTAVDFYGRALRFGFEGIMDAIFLPFALATLISGIRTRHACAVIAAVLQDCNQCPMHVKVGNYSRIFSRTMLIKLSFVVVFDWICLVAVTFLCVTWRFRQAVSINRNFVRVLSRPPLRNDVLSLNMHRQICRCFAAFVLDIPFIMLTPFTLWRFPGLLHDARPTVSCAEVKKLSGKRSNDAAETKSPRVSVEVVIERRKIFLAFVEVLKDLPFVALLLIIGIAFPWRLRSILLLWSRNRDAATSAKFGYDDWTLRLFIFGCALFGSIDAIVILLNLPVAFTLWRARTSIGLMRELSISGRAKFSTREHPFDLLRKQFFLHRSLIKQFFGWMLDLPYIPAALLCCILVPWRAMLLLQHFSDVTNTDRRRIVLKCLLLGFLDYVCLFACVPVIMTVWRASSTIAALRSLFSSCFISVKNANYESSRSPFDFGSHEPVFNQIRAWLLDLPFILPLTAVLLTLHRFPSLRRAIKGAKLDSTIRLRILQHFGMVVQDIILVPLVCVLILVTAPWRLKFVFRPGAEPGPTPDSNALNYFWYSCYHGCLYGALLDAIADMPYSIAFAFVFLVAPWRLYRLAQVLRVPSLAGRRSSVADAFHQACVDWITLTPVFALIVTLSAYRAPTCYCAVFAQTLDHQQRLVWRKNACFFFADVACIGVALPLLCICGGFWRLPTLIKEIRNCADRQTLLERPFLLHRMVVEEVFWALVDLWQLFEVLLILVTAMHVHALVVRILAVRALRARQVAKKLQSVEPATAVARANPRELPDVAMSGSIFAQLPRDVLIAEIFARLSCIDAARISQVCRLWSLPEFGRSPELWGALFRRDFPTRALLQIDCFNVSHLHRAHPFSQYKRTAAQTSLTRVLWDTRRAGAAALASEDGSDTFFHDPFCGNLKARVRADAVTGYRSIVHSEFLGALSHLPHTMVIPLKICGVLLYPVLLYSRWRKQTSLNIAASGVPPSFGQTLKLVWHFPSLLRPPVTARWQIVDLPSAHASRHFTVWHAHVAVFWLLLEFLRVVLHEATILLLGIGSIILLFPLTRFPTVAQAVVLPIFVIFQMLLLLLPVHQFLWPSLPSGYVLWIPCLLFGSMPWLVVVLNSWFCVFEMAKVHFPTFRPDRGAVQVWNLINSVAQLVSGFIFNAILNALSTVKSIAEAVWSAFVIVAAALGRLSLRMIYWIILLTQSLDWCLGYLTHKCKINGTVVGELILIPLSLAYILFPLTVAWYLPSRDIVLGIQNHAAVDLHRSALSVEHFLQAALPFTEMASFHEDSNAPREWPLWIPFIFLTLVQLRRVKKVVEQNWVKESKQAGYRSLFGMNIPVEQQCRVLLDISSVTVSSPVTSDGHGLQIHICAASPTRPKTTAPSNLSNNPRQTPHVRLTIEGDEFWKCSTAIGGRGIITTVRHTMLPLQITPHYFEASGMEDLFDPTATAAQVNARIFLGTGDRGNKRLKFKRATIEPLLQNLRDHGDPTFTLRLELGNYSWGAWSQIGILAAIETSPSRLIYALTQGGDARNPQLAPSQY